jgi:hypothetical protein
VKLADLGFRAQRWTDTHGVVHGWYVDLAEPHRDRVSFCGLLLFSKSELDAVGVRFFPARFVDADQELYDDGPVTCLACMNNGALDQ